MSLMLELRCHVVEISVPHIESMDSYGTACFSRFFQSIFQGNGNAGHLGNSRVHGDQAGMASPWTPCAVSRSGVSKQWPVGQIWPPRVFINKTVLTHSYLMHLRTVSAAFMLPWQSCVVATEIVCTNTSCKVLRLYYLVLYKKS